MSVTSRCTKQLLEVCCTCLQTKTRPDIAYAVSSVPRYCAKPIRDHWAALKGILRYLKGTHNYGLQYRKNAPAELTGYSDSDWAGDIADRKSTSGCMFLMGGGAVSWRSNKQTCVALSTAEAEYVALYAASQEAMWLQQLVSDLINKRVQQTAILEDSQSIICLAKYPLAYGRTKRVDIKYHFVRDLVEAEQIKLIYCASENMVADMLTKGLPIKQFEGLRELTLNVLTEIEKEYWRYAISEVHMATYLDLT